MQSPLDAMLKGIARRMTPLVGDALAPLATREIRALRDDLALLVQREILDRIRPVEDRIGVLERAPASGVSPIFADEPTEAYRKRLIDEILAEYPNAADAYTAILEEINSLADPAIREHSACHQVRYLLTYVMVPVGPGRLLDVWDLIRPVLTRFKSWEIEAAAPAGLDLEAERLPFDDGSIDGVLLCEVIEHFIADPMFCLIEVNRVLRPGGFIVLSTPNAASWFAIYQALQQRQPNRYANYGVDRKRYIHAREYIPSEIVLLLEAAGFGDLRISTRDYGIAPPYRPISGFDPTHRGETIFCLGYKQSQPRKRYLRPIYLDDRDFAGFAAG